MLSKVREDFKVIGKYGVKFLDDYLLGIKQTDFILIGAYSGAGKTELAYNIAFENAKKTNVHLFALEAKQGPERQLLHLPQA